MLSVPGIPVQTATSAHLTDSVRVLMLLAYMNAPLKSESCTCEKQCRRKNVGKIVTHPLSIGQKRCAQVTTGSTKPICFEQV